MKVYTFRREETRYVVHIIQVASDEPPDEADRDEDFETFLNSNVLVDDKVEVNEIEAECWEQE